MKELNFFKKAINKISLEYCDSTGERMNVAVGGNYYGESADICKSCDGSESCPVTQMRESDDYILGQEYSEKL